ncbi:MAG TPA: hypothetical protein VGH27_03600 [Streptosporangiaceae bacterium]
MATLSASNAWAVGDYSDGDASRTLIEHWNGSKWANIASPGPGATSATCPSTAPDRHPPRK